MLWRAYQYYSENGGTRGTAGISAHRKAAEIGVMRLLK